MRNGVKYNRNKTKKGKVQDHVTIMTNGISSGWANITFWMLVSLIESPTLQSEWSINEFGGKHGVAQ
jgi:hypothetical protein